MDLSLVMCDGNVVMMTPCVWTMSVSIKTSRSISFTTTSDIVFLNSLLFSESTTASLIPLFSRTLSLS